MGGRLHLILGDMERTRAERPHAGHLRHRPVDVSGVGVHDRDEPIGVPGTVVGQEAVGCLEDVAEQIHAPGDHGLGHRQNAHARVDELHVDALLVAVGQPGVGVVEGVVIRGVEAIRLARRVALLEDAHIGRHQVQRILGLELGRQHLRPHAASGPQQIYVLHRRELGRQGRVHHADPVRRFLEVAVGIDDSQGLAFLPFVRSCPIN